MFMCIFLKQRVHALYGSAISRLYEIPFCPSTCGRSEHVLRAYLRFPEADLLRLVRRVSCYRLRLITKRGRRAGCFEKMIARWWGLESWNIGDMIVTADSISLSFSFSPRFKHRRRTNRFYASLSFSLLELTAWWMSGPLFSSSRFLRYSLVIARVADLGC